MLLNIVRPSQKDKCPSLIEVMALRKTINVLDMLANTKWTVWMSFQAEKAEKNIPHMPKNKSQSDWKNFQIINLKTLSIFLFKVAIRNSLAEEF